MRQSVRLIIMLAAADSFNPRLRSTAVNETTELWERRVDPSRRHHLVVTGGTHGVSATHSVFVVVMEVERQVWLRRVEL